MRRHVWRWHLSDWLIPLCLLLSHYLVFYYCLRLLKLTLHLLLKFNQELGVIFSLVVVVLLTSAVLLPAKRRGVFKEYSTVLTIKIRHVDLI